MTEKTAGRKRKRAKTSTKRRARKSPAATARSRRIYRQCTHCGAPVDQKFGVGDTSWCPHCHEPGWVLENVGELPDPQMYGYWCLEQEDATEKSDTPSDSPLSLNTPMPGQSLGTNAWKGFKMKTPKYHSGRYCCPNCCTEFLLIAETVLKCDDCRGPLVSGSLDDYWKAEDERDARSSRR